MGWVDPEQIRQAKQIDILDYLRQYEPQNLIPQGNDRYTLRDHDSFVISNQKWCWFSRAIGCETATALNYLIKVRGYDFVGAVETLAGITPTYTHTNPSKEKPPPEKRQFILPPRNQDNRRVIAYLQSRGIDKALILDCIERGILYESATQHNCVFLGKNEDGKIRFGCMRSITGRFRRDLDGSDKRYSFLLPPERPENIHKIAAFEAPIDALAHQTMNRQGFIAWDGWRLALSGGSLMALTHFLEQRPEVNQVFVCTDRDEAGHNITEKIRSLPKDKRFSHVSVIPGPPAVGNDYNDTLLTLQRARREQSHPTISNRKDGHSL